MGLTYLFDASVRRLYSLRMRDVVVTLLRHAAEASGVRPFWDRAAETLSEAAGGARVTLEYEGVRESGRAAAGAAPAPDTGTRLTFERRDPEGRRVCALVEGSAPPDPLIEHALEVAHTLAVMVGRRAGLERERRLGTFLVELSRWLLAAPERDLLLRYTLQSVTKLVEAQGAYVALREAGSDMLRVVTTVGAAANIQDDLLDLHASTTGRVVRTGEALASDDLRREPDVSAAARAASETVRAAMIAPLKTTAGVVGAVAVLRYAPADGTSPDAFSLAELHYFTAVAAHIAGGLELTQAVAASRVAAARAGAMVNASPLPMLLVDADGRVQQLNAAAAGVLGLDEPDEAMGRHLDGLGLSPSEVPLRMVLQGRLTGEPWHGRVLVTQRSGDRRICDCTVAGLSGLGSRDLMVALYDRTDELRAQRELIAREKLATVGEIASGVAHEVNNPLTAIRMEAELLSRATRDPDTSAATDTIVREVDRAARIVRSLLRLARRADTAPTKVQINELVRDVSEIRQRVLRSDNIEVETRLDHGASPVLGLGQELQQVVINLVTNAEHVVRGRTPAVIRLTTQSRDDWVRLIVEDSGPGVPAGVRDRIFDPFFTTKGPDEGSGLGLAICQRVVAEVGGKIWLEESADLGGAKFVVELPAAPERADVIG